MSASTEVLSDRYIGNRLQNVAITFIVLDTILVGLRFASRYSSRMPVAWDDFLVLPGLVFNCALCGVSIAMVKYGGLGHHLDWVYVNEPMALTTFAKLQVPFTICWELAILFPKLTILGLYLRIFVQRSQRIATYVLISILISYCAAQITATSLQCIPLSYLWDPAGHPGGHCVNFNSLWAWGSFPNIVTDILMLILPLPCLLKLRLATRDKVGLVATFCLGSIGLITSIVRFAEFYQTNGQQDSTWSSIRLGCISCAEAGVYLIAACLPTFRSLFRSVRTRVGLSSLASRGTEQYPEPKLILGHSNQAKVYSNDSFNGFELLENVERASKETSSVELNSYEPAKHIRVKHQYIVATASK